MSTLAPFMTAQIEAIAEDVFAAMIDGEPGHLVPLPDVAPLTEPVYAWVDMHADVAGRALLATDVATAHDLARALLAMGADEPVGEEDLVDAFGEVANVVGGNLKALLPVQGTLTLPQVDRERPALDGATQVDAVALLWRGRPLDITVWQI
ncbi:chemotaxis protein CheX [Cellulomonas sp. ATA003]|uniref:chemotaxis protein CheX n=1 Tax=Cellulomonas sp. ATA003 TaxID=3073064 RepID=UPI0028738D24|nr:chemotaxis protein CheX [Cellulomonas sp. ATA003]WNB85218.1 chemotaxis protein CheX [Cellulomonas sp. ATA003]